MHSRSLAPSAIALAQERALLTILKWVSVAPFGEPVVPEVNWILMASSGSSAADSASSRARCAGPATARNAANRIAPGRQRPLVENDHMPQVRQLRGLQSRRIDAVDLRRERAHHGEIVARLQRARHDQDFALHLVERVFELGALVGRVDVDQDRADARGAELRVKPFGAVGRPDADAVAALHTEREQAGRDVVGMAAQIVPGQALAACEDRRVARAVARAGAIEKLRDGHELERIVARPRHIGERARRAQMVVGPPDPETPS